MTVLIKAMLAMLAVVASSMLAPSASAATLPAVAPVVACGALRGFKPDLPGYPTQISAAREVDGQCRVEGYVSPAIRFEVRLPLAGWTQRYLQTGCGGLCGNLRIEAPQRPCPALVRGEFVTASTDMGHAGGGGTWGAADQQVRVDFGYRGVHATALVAKALIARFYGQAPRWSYFSGCSDGGREALMEAQRYPQDFDGIAAGAPAMNFLVQNTIHHGWQARQVAPDGRTSLLHAPDMAVVHAAAVAACDLDDGVKDGLISSPLTCRFDPRTVVCKPGQAAGCLTARQVAVVADLYAGAHDGRGNKLVVRGLMPGSELAWPGVALPREPRAGPPPGPPPAAAGGAPSGPPPGPPPPEPGTEDLPGSTNFASDVIPYLAYPDALPATWRFADFRFELATLAGLKAMHGTYDSTDPDLRPFAAHGGKLLLWHGWSDQHISPANTVAYVQAVAATMGQAAADAMLRAFLIPGMYHCGSGDGLTSIDVLTPLMAWVEDRQAPVSITASRDPAAAAAGKGRKVFAWPASSRLAAGADPEQPANWAPGAPIGEVGRLDRGWAGADFYRPGYLTDCGFAGGRWVCRPVAAAPAARDRSPPPS